MSASCPGVQITTAETRHLQGIAAIYDRECLHGIATFMSQPRTTDEWYAWLEEHSALRRCAIAAVKADDVLGFATFSPWSLREGYARTVEISVYVAEHAQGRGVGTRLMLELFDRARDCGACVMIARVVEQNAGSVAFHEHLGFGTIGIQRRAGEKFGRLLDVRIMDKHLDLE